MSPAGNAEAVTPQRGRPPHRRVRTARAVVLAVAFAAAVVAVTCGTDGRSAIDSASVTQPAAAPETTSTTVFEPRSFTVAATGDLLLHTRVLEFAQANAGGSGYDFDPMFAEIAPLISAADLAICHLEVPLSADNSVIADFPLFSGPREIIGAVRRAGYDGCSTASNHSLDQGTTGVFDTVGVFEDEGVGQSGMARSAQEAATPPIYDAAGVAVGHLSYTYGLNGMPLPEPWMANLIDPERIVADAAALRDRGAEVVLVSMHWGNEYQHEPSIEQLELAEVLTADDNIDGIIGAHVHVIQPIDTVNDKPVVYGMGNSLSNQMIPVVRQDGMIAYLTFTEVAPGEFETTNVAYTPTFVTYPGTIISPATPDRLPESYARTSEFLSTLGFDGPAVFDPAELR